MQKEEPFKPGELVEFCGDRATVVENHGSYGIVDQDGDRFKWYWIFQGEPVKRVRI